MLLLFFFSRETLVGLGKVLPQVHGDFVPRLRGAVVRRGETVVAGGDAEEVPQPEELRGMREGLRGRQ